MTDIRPLAPSLTGNSLEKLAFFCSMGEPTPDASTLRRLRDGVVDTVGCILVGCQTDVARQTRDAVRAMDTSGAQPVLGTSLRTSRSHAALLNATAGHALDFDDWEIPGNTHPTVVLLPALLAAAEPDTTGHDLIVPYLVGFETLARLGEAMNFKHYDAGWHTTATLGTIGAAAAVARLRGLDPTRTANALALSVSRATGYTCQFGSHAKPLQAGFAAQAGVECALLAEAGATAQSQVFDHQRGMMALMGEFDQYQLNAALERVGSPLALSEYGLVLKPWPSCGYTHRIMTCALQLAPQIKKSGQIQQINLHLPDFHAAILPFQRPQSRSEALFSLPFVCAIGLARRRLTLDDVNRCTWDDPDIMRLIERTSVHPYTPRRPDQNYCPDDPDRLEITLENGQRLSAACVYPIGAPQNPLPEAQLREKFLANAGPTAAARIDDVFDWQNATSVLSLFTDIGEPK